MCMGGLRCLSVFSGIGAHDLGLSWAGVEIVGQVEIDPYCAAVLERHWPGLPRWGDVRDVRADDVLARCGRIDLIMGGVPCQPASVAGKRLGSADTRWLWPEYLRLVVALRPRWLLAENVPGFLSLAESERVFADLESAGYEVQPYVAGAWAVGAPHKRDRVWIVGRRFGVRQADSLQPGSSSQRQRGDGVSGGSVVDALDASSVADAPSWQREVDGWPAGGWWSSGQEDHARGAWPPLRWPARPGEAQHEWEAPSLIGPTQPGVGDATARATRRLAGFARRNALKALGNANPPYIPYLIGEWLMAQDEVA